MSLPPLVSLPLHRRPFWAKNAQSYEIHITNYEERHRSNALDHGSDNFSFDPDLVGEWQIPALIARDLHSSLREPMKDWIYSGAAVATGLERIDELFATAVDRAFPTSSHPHLFNREMTKTIDSPIVGPSAVIVPDTPPQSTPAGHATSDSALKLSLDKLKLQARLPPRLTEIGMESPPVTPVDREGCRTPDNFHADVGNSNPEVQKIVTGELTPPQSASTSFTLVPPALDPEAHMNEPAWETFIGMCKAEQTNLRSNALMNLKGYALIVDRVLVDLDMEYACSGTSDTDQKALDNFIDWWRTVAKPNMAEYEKKVKAVTLPTREEMLLDRNHMLGLAV